MPAATSNSSASTISTAPGFFMVRADLGIAGGHPNWRCATGRGVTSGSATEPHLDDFFRHQQHHLCRSARGRQPRRPGAVHRGKLRGSGWGDFPAVPRPAPPSRHRANMSSCPRSWSKEPLGGRPCGTATTNGGRQIVRWTLNALIAAEEYGVTSVNVMDLAEEADRQPRDQPPLGTEGSLGAMLGLPR